MNRNMRKVEFILGLSEEYLQEKVYSRICLGPIHPTLKTPCQLWKGPTCNGEYGLVTLRDDRVKFTILTHSIIWIRVHETIHKKSHLDHLCRTPKCVALDHLKEVTARTNSLRGMGVSGINARKTHCTNGHPFSKENTIKSVNQCGYLRRHCRTCMRDGQRQKKHRSQFQPQEVFHDTNRSLSTSPTPMLLQDSRTTSSTTG